MTIELYALVPAARAFQFLGIGGPLIILTALHNVAAAGVVYDHNTWDTHPERGPERLDRDVLTFTEESAVTELRGQRAALFRRLVDRLAAAFGLWRHEPPPAT